MFVRQVKRKCSVRGCKSTECFAVSRTREVGNTVIICKSCLGKALGAIDEIDPKTKSNIPVAKNTSAPSLFFNAGVTETKNDTIPPETPNNRLANATPPIEDGNKEPESGSDTLPADGGEKEREQSDDVTEFKCPICGKTFDSEKGLKTHLRYCKPQTDKE